MLLTLRPWLRIAFFNLLLTAAAGTLLRCKIAFPLPFIDQKYLLHGHSHFALTGWISQALMALLAAQLSGKGGNGAISKKYRLLLLANLAAAYGMLISFTLQGYGAWSVSFSTLSIFVSWFFAAAYRRDMQVYGMQGSQRQWFSAALFFNVLSAAGTFFLAWMMMTHQVSQRWYLASVYFFLHFQYNGWFFFACMGLVAPVIEKVAGSPAALRQVFLLFAAACVPAWLLSALWLPVPGIIYWLVVIAAAAQVAAWVLLLRLLHRHRKALCMELPAPARLLLLLCAAALSIKLLLQLGSVIPSLSILAFGFRPIVIGYLHLVLLGVITLFIIACGFAFRIIAGGKAALYGTYLFAGGVVANECLLMLQGVAAFSTTAVAGINELLLAAAVMMLAGLLLLNTALLRR